MSATEEEQQKVEEPPPENPELEEAKVEDTGKDEVEDTAKDDVEDDLFAEDSSPPPSQENEDPTAAIKQEDTSPAVKSEEIPAADEPPASNEDDDDSHRRPEIPAADEPPASNEEEDDDSHRPPDPRISVPRKAPTTPSSNSDPRSPPSSSSLLGNTTSEAGSTPTRPGYLGTTVGLPEGIIVPNRVDSKLLHGRLLDTLKQLPLDLITDALNEYDDALQNKGSTIRNQGAYLYGVIKRYVRVQERASEGNGQEVMGKTLTPTVTERLDKLVQDGFCSQDEMNDKVKSKIRMLSEKDALFAIDELASVERGSIRNFSSYFMGILNRYMRGDTSTGGPSKSHRRDDFARDRDDYRNQRSRYDDPPRYPSMDRNDRDRYRGRSPDRDRDYRRRDDRYGDRDDDRYGRDRSRDRYDDDRRGDYGRHESSRSYRDPRDPRSRYDDRSRSAPQPSTYGSSGSYGPSSAPPPPPPRQQGGMPQGMNPYAPQPTQQMQPQPQQQSQQMFVPPNQQQPQQQMFQQQMPQQQFVPQQILPQQTMMQQQTPQASQPQQTFMTSMQPQQTTMQPQQQPMMTSMQPQQTTMQPQANTTPNIPADILGLADKAASAVQMLQASQSSAPFATMPPQQQMMPNMNQFPFVMPPTKPAYRRSHATAKMSDLPVMVQYAVQNLQATGHVDGILDEGILGMINELPEPLALGALQRFASIDTATMRNKTAYLAGVLRRELEKNNQR